MSSPRVCTVLTDCLYEILCWQSAYHVCFDPLHVLPAIDSISNSMMDALASPSIVCKMSDTHVMTADARHVVVEILCL